MNNFVIYTPEQLKRGRSTFSHDLAPEVWNTPQRSLTCWNGATSTMAAWRWPSPRRFLPRRPRFRSGSGTAVAGHAGCSTDAGNGGGWRLDTFLATKAEMRRRHPSRPSVLSRIWRWATALFVAACAQPSRNAQRSQSQMRGVLTIPAFRRPSPTETEMARVGRRQPLSRWASEADHPVFVKCLLSPRRFRLAFSEPKKWQKPLMDRRILIKPQSTIPPLRALLAASTTPRNTYLALPSSFKAGRIIGLAT